jgi:hypothetical protein
MIIYHLIIDYLIYKILEYLISTFYKLFNNRWDKESWLKEESES